MKLKKMATNDKKEWEDGLQNEGVFEGLFY